MESSIDFLNKAMKSYSGYQLTKMLGLSSTGVVSTWKKRGHVSVYYAGKLAQLIGENPARAMAIAGAEGESDAEKRAELLQMLAEDQSNIFSYNQPRADVAQLVEQLIRNQ